MDEVFEEQRLGVSKSNDVLAFPHDNNFNNE